jgi:hypothetical protein|tara:strand:+ start:282 stop:506 length:225 start_codon:yes stop_codon:yes gene_type:complete
MLKLIFLKCLPKTFWKKKRGPHRRHLTYNSLGHADAALREKLLSENVLELPDTLTNASPPPRLRSLLHFNVKSA